MVKGRESERLFSNSRLWRTRPCSFGFFYSITSMEEDPSLESNKETSRSTSFRDFSAMLQHRRAWRSWWSVAQTGRCDLYLYEQCASVDWFESSEIFRSYQWWKKSIGRKKRSTCLFICLAVGSFQATMRELADDLLLSPSTSIIVDSRESAGKEAGELIQSKVVEWLGILSFIDYFRRRSKQN